MTFFHLIIVSLVQGITEFLPISSSAHLVLTPVVLGEHDQGLIIDVAAHLGTLFAVLLYFRREILEMLCVVTGRETELPKDSPYSGWHIILCLLIGSLPVIIAGFFVHEYMMAMIRNVHIIMWTTLIFAILLYIGDTYFKSEKRIAEMSYKNALIIGFAQCFALFPGTSRSGVTMTAARFLGFHRVAAAKFSLLLSIPAICGASALSFYDLLTMENGLIIGIDAIMAILLSFASAYGAIHFMLKWLEKQSFTIFVIYRMILGVLLFFYLYI